MAITAADIREKREELTAPGGFFELGEVELDGFSYACYKHAPATTIDVLQAGRNHGDAELVIYEGERYTYHRFFEKVDAMAASLQNDYKVTKGDRVAIAMRNCPQWMIAYAAATLVGAIVVPINSWGKTEELTYALSDSKASVLVCDLPRFKLIAGELANLSVKVVVTAANGEVEAGDQVALMDDVIVAGEGQSYAIDDAKSEDNCVILYTSGSTGAPKGVVHRHLSVTQSLMNMMYSGMQVMSLEGAREFKGGATVETPLVTVPLFHATGLLGSYLLPLYAGQKLIMMYKWDVAQALQLIQSEKVTSLSTVPAIVQDLLAHPDFDDYNTESLIRVSGAGAATPAGLPELIKEKVGEVSRSAGYAMTETMAVCSIMSGCIYDMKPNASGVMSPIMRLRTVDPDDNVLEQGQAGEIELYGVNCTPGYWEKPEANEKTFDSERWMKTGDVGYVDDEDFVHITGRIKEIVIRGGENIYPGEIEQVAYQLDETHEVVVFGEPDDAMGEEMVMVVYLHPGMELSEEILRSHLKEKLAGYKVPRKILFTSQAMPRNASEKLHKLKVREMHLAGELN